MNALNSHPFLIGFDSDGCAFDNMTVKHQRAFGPAFIDVYGLNAVAGRAAQIWDFVNLFGRTRGCNRFRGVINSLRWLHQCPDITIPLPDVSALEKCVLPAGTYAVFRTGCGCFRCQTLFLFLTKTFFLSFSGCFFFL